MPSCLCTAPASVRSRVWPCHHVQREETERSAYDAERLIGCRNKCRVKPHARSSAPLSVSSLGFSLSLFLTFFLSSFFCRISMLQEHSSRRFLHVGGSPQTLRLHRSMGLAPCERSSSPAGGLYFYSSLFPSSPLLGHLSFLSGSLSVFVLSVLS